MDEIPTPITDAHENTPFGHAVTCPPPGFMTVESRIVKEIERRLTTLRSTLGEIREVMCNALPDMNAPTLEMTRELVRQRDSQRQLAGELIAAIRINMNRGAFTSEITTMTVEEWLSPFEDRLQPFIKHLNQ